MMFSHFIGTVLMIITSALLASARVVVERAPPALLKAPLGGYALIEPVMEGNLFGKPFKLNGTVEVRKDAARI